MIVRRTPFVFLILALAVLVLAGRASTAPPPAPPDPSCSPGPSNCFAWHTAAVTVSWASPPAGVTASGCGAVTISSDTGGTGVSCTWSNAEGSRTTTTNVRKDGTPPAVTASADRGPDSNGWYNHGLTINFSGSDGVSGIGSCTSTDYKGPDTDHTSVSGSCTDNAGNSNGTGFELKYDATRAERRGKARAGAGLQRLVQPRGNGRLPGDGPIVRCRLLRRNRSSTRGPTRRRLRCRAPARTRPQTRARPPASTSDTTRDPRFSDV